MTEVTIADNSKIEVPIRRVIKTDEGYVVAEFKSVQANLWVFISRYYEHSTSAFAVLGKLYQKDVVDALPERYLKGTTPIPEVEKDWSGNNKIKTRRFENGREI